MTWWYENEEKKMEFDKSRCYSALNADELKPGDKVIVGSSLLELKANVECNRRCGNIVEIGGECSNRRFTVDDVDGRGETYWELAYLVERKENCTNCEGCVACIKPDKTFGCEDWKPKTEKKTCLYCNHYSTDFCYKNHHVTKNYNEACADFDDLPVKKIDREIYDYYNEKKEINMWNYTSEKLPEKQEMGVSDRVVVAVRGYNTVDVGYYDYELEAWFVDNNRYPVPVYAWHYDKPPKEEV